MFVLLRAMAILAIVLHHSFGAFIGILPNSPVCTSLPKWCLAVSAHCKVIGLDLFVFMAGWFAISSWRRHACSYWRFVLDKIRRILLPCVIAAGFYALLFPNFMYDYFPAPINGTHLWFLPMIFVCYLTAPLLSRLQSMGGFASVLFIILFSLSAVLLRWLLPGRTVAELAAYWPIFAFASTLGTCGELRAWASSGFPSSGYWNVVEMLSRHSFGVYLVHQFVINALIGTFAGWLVMNRFCGVAVVFALTIVFSTISSVLFVKVCHKEKR